MSQCEYFDQYLQNYQGFYLSNSKFTDPVKDVRVCIGFYKKKLILVAFFKIYNGGFNYGFTYKQFTYFIEIDINEYPYYLSLLQIIQKKWNEEYTKCRRNYDGVCHCGNDVKYKCESIAPIHET